VHTFYFDSNFAKYWPILVNTGLIKILSLSHSEINYRKSWNKIYLRLCFNSTDVYIDVCRGTSLNGCTANIVKTWTTLSFCYNSSAMTTTFSRYYKPNDQHRCSTMTATNHACRPQIMTMTATDMFSEDGITWIRREFGDFLKALRYCFWRFHCYGCTGNTLWPSWYRPLMLNTQRRRRRNETVESRRVGGVNTNSQLVGCRRCEHTRRQSWTGSRPTAALCVRIAESVGSRREYMYTPPTTDATRIDSFVSSASAVCIGLNIGVYGGNTTYVG